MSSLGRAALIVPAAAVALAAATFGILTGLTGLGIALALATLLAWALNGRIAIDPFAQGVGTLIAVLAAVTATLIALAERPVVEQVMLGCALVSLAIGAFRIAQARPRYGQRGTVAMVLIPLIVAGVMPASALYLFAVVGYVLLALATLILEDPAEPMPGRVSLPRALGLAAFVGLATLTALSLTLTLPAAHQWALRHALSGDYSHTAFGGHFRLGSLSRIMTSERLALRIRGPAPRYLRGAVYAFYHDGTWSGVSEHLGRTLRVPILERLQPSRDWVEVENFTERSPSLPLPLTATALATPGGEVQATPAGVILPRPDETIERYAFLSEEGLSQANRRASRHLAGVSAPQPSDLVVPERLRAPLTRLAERWLAGARDVEGRVRALERHLQRGYRYTLNRNGEPDEDPVVDFLMRHKAGHCEFFASAMTLLARSVGIPARVVGGYLVTERNPYGDFYVARERDAHAWSEIWWDGTWHTVDATPPGAVVAAVRPATPWQRAMAEFIAAELALWIDEVGNSVLYLLIAVLGLALVVLRVRALRALRRQRDAGETALAPLPCYEGIAAYLAEQGLARHPAETLHAHARRLRDAGWTPFADWLQRYAAFRYGRIGNEAELASSARALLTREARGSG